MPRRIRWLLATTTVVATLQAVPGTPALANPTPDLTTPNPATAAPAGSGETHTVTLLTGDVVTVEATGSGCPRVRVQPVDPAGVIRRSCGVDGHLKVIPATVAAQVGTVLDPDLFDVTTLIADGYDDESTTELPVIVQPAENQRTTALAGLRPLSSIGAVAGAVPKRSAANARAATTTLLTGARKVWLDRKVHATGITAGNHGGGQPAQLDHNISQVSAPQAWQAGYTGKGTRVAVLDTGADFSHPDLAGRVVDRADFVTTGGDAVDHNGHGTHVATTIAGTGAASHGQRRGIAPDARLVIGKVLDDFGSGSDSDIITGMEWAAARADVINMSLGGAMPDDGTDPMAVAVDNLTEQTDALFVIAAGNSGGAIASPGSAGRALTVGAVDADDERADFSSRGPLINTWAAKPELVAPGVDIVAGRAAGTTLGTPFDEHHTTLSGTSMAAPHAAGAAALLAQRHPDWTADRLKAGLVGAADPLPDAEPYTVGAGRLNAARALTGPVSDQPVVNLGTFSYPQSGTSEVRLSWTGDRTPATVPLDLAITVANHDGTTAPRRAAKLSTTRVTLKGGVPGTATLRLDRAALAGSPGYYLATVTARTPNHALVATTPVAFYVEPRSYDLTIQTRAVPGAPVNGYSAVGVEVTNLADPLLYGGGAFFTPGKSATLRVPAGRYQVTAAFTTYNDETGAQTGAFVGDSDIAVDGPRTVILDSTQAKPSTATVSGKPTQALASDFLYVQTAVNGLSWWQAIAAWGDSATVAVGPVTLPSVGSLRMYGGWGLDSPAGTAAPYHYDLAHEYTEGVPADPTYRVTAAEQARLARIDQRFNQLDLAGMVTSMRRAGFTPDGFYLTQNPTYDLPATRTEYVSPGFLWQDTGTYGGLPAQEAPRDYAPGSRQTKIWARQPLRSDWFDDPAGGEYSCAGAPWRSSGNLHVDLAMLVDQHQRADCLQPGAVGITRTLALYRDGQLVDERNAARTDFSVPAKAADYRLTFDVDTSRILPFSTHVNTAWTFRSAGPAGTARSALPLLSVDYALPLDAANHPTGGPATFTVRQAQGAPAQRVTTFQVWTSTDDGVTWQPTTVDRDRDGYHAALPTVTGGQAVSLRVKATADGGSGIEQTIIRAYRAG
ncbi:S8 family serine peptidase [Micromonospora cremea]|uniref:Subtilase family protein n=1 Tax=Micromonospora cremea TaxID=709881 RepID=A0A1N5VGU0_9ACTN|nr:S8 family serine peptidase [Micromonospora cremea]SIM72233.1 Subtilase family protein [Micromonospora cremea]